MREGRSPERGDRGRGAIAGLLKLNITAISPIGVSASEQLRGGGMSCCGLLKGEGRRIAEYGVPPREHLDDAFGSTDG